jgi:hypothetical protein
VRCIGKAPERHRVAATRPAPAEGARRRAFARVPTARGGRSGQKPAAGVFQ